MNTKDIINLSFDELSELEGWIGLAEEAFLAADLIKERYANAFTYGRKEIQVYEAKHEDGYNVRGYLSKDGTLKFVDNLMGKREYSFKCDGEGIYKFIRSFYLKRVNMSNLDPEPIECPIYDLDTIFGDFIKHPRNDNDSAN